MSRGGGLVPTTAGAPRHLPQQRMPDFDVRPTLSPFDQVPKPPRAESGAREPVLGSPFERVGPAAVDPAAAPLPRSFDHASARDLENKGFRPLSSLSTRGEVPPAKPSMEPASNEPSRPQPSPQPEWGFRSPFEIAEPPTGRQWRPDLLHAPPSAAAAAVAGPARSAFDFAPPAAHTPAPVAFRVAAASRAGAAAIAVRIGGAAGSGSSGERRGTGSPGAGTGRR